MTQLFTVSLFPSRDLRRVPTSERANERRLETTLYRKFPCERDCLPRYSHEAAETFALIGRHCMTRTPFRPSKGLVAGLVRRLLTRLTWPASAGASHPSLRLVVSRATSDRFLGAWVGPALPALSHARPRLPASQVSSLFTWSLSGRLCSSPCGLAKSGRGVGVFESGFSKQKDMRWVWFLATCLTARKWNRTCFPRRIRRQRSWTELLCSKSLMNDTIFT